jgi:tetratricopeptide (TPR) repeat protein
MAAGKTPDPKSSSKDSAKASQMQKALETNKAKKAAEAAAVAADEKKKTFDPKRDPKTYSEQELLQMVDDGEILSTWTPESFKKFVLGEITWAELTGLTMQEAYAFAEIAYNLFEQGKYDQAQTIVEGLVISNPYDGYFHGLLGAIYGRKGMHEEAAEEYSIAIELDPTNLSAFVNRAEILLQHGEIELALKDLKSAIDLDPKGEKPFGVRARALAAATASILEEAMKQQGIEIPKDPSAVAAAAAKAKAAKAATPSKSGPKAASKPGSKKPAKS